MASSVYTNVLQASHEKGSYVTNKPGMGNLFLELAQCAPSRSRRHRRGLVLLTIFEAVARHADMMDIAELKQFLVEEREKLENMVHLIANKRMRLPAVKYRFDQHLREHFSLLRSVICCLLLDSCHQLQEKFDEYDSNGIGAITELGFLTVCESCFREVSQCTDATIFSSVIQELKGEGEKAFAHSYEAGKINNSAWQGAVRGGGDLMTLMEERSQGDQSGGSGGGKGGSGSATASEYEFDEGDEDVVDERAQATKQSQTQARSQAPVHSTGSPNASSRQTGSSLVTQHQAAVAHHLPRRQIPPDKPVGDADAGEARMKRVLSEANFDDTPVAIWMVRLTFISGLVML